MLAFKVVIHHGRNALATGLLLGQTHLFVELGVFVFVLALAIGDGRAGMLVQDARYEIWDDVAPLDLLAHRDHVVLNDFEDGRQVEFRILQETDEQFEAAIAGAAADAVQRAVHVVGVVDDAFDGVRVGELLLVVAMDANRLAGQVLLIELDHIFDLLAIERAEAIDDVHHVHGRFGELIERFDEVGFDLLRDGHDVAGRFVAEVVTFVD